MTNPIQTAIEAINSAPRSLNGGVYWMADPTLMTKVAISIIGSNNLPAAMKEITAATGVTEPTLRLFVRGKDAQQKTCQIILDGLKNAGLSPVAFTPRPNRSYGKKYGSISAASHHANQQSEAPHLAGQENQAQPKRPAQTGNERRDADNFQTALKSARTEKGMTHESLGAAMSPPVSGILIDRWERTDLQPSVSQIQRLCRALQISANALLGIKAMPRLIHEGAIEGKKYKVYINDETKDVRVNFYYKFDVHVYFYYKFESKEWCNVMAHINGPKY